jgi:hypothetical protein
MRIRPFKVGTAIALIGGLMAEALPAAAAVDPFDGNWHFGVTPYLWLPNVNANLDHYFPASPDQPASDRDRSKQLSGEPRARAAGDR